MKRQVVLCVAADMSAETIAAIMGLPVDRLNAAFAHELKHGREIVRAEELMRLDAQSGQGKTAATKAMLATAGGSSAKSGAAGSGKIDDGNNLRVAALRILDGGRK